MRRRSGSTLDGCRCAPAARGHAAGGGLTPPPCSGAAVQAHLLGPRRPGSAARHLGKVLLRGARTDLRRRRRRHGADRRVAKRARAARRVARAAAREPPLSPGSAAAVARRSRCSTRCSATLTSRAFRCCCSQTSRTRKARCPRTRWRRGSGCSRCLRRASRAKSLAPPLSPASASRRASTGSWRREIAEMS